MLRLAERMHSVANSEALKPSIAIMPQPERPPGAAQLNPAQRRLRNFRERRETHPPLDRFASSDFDQEHISQRVG